MFRQFWTDCAVIFGLACIGFAGFALPDWAILDTELASDAIPLSILLFCNEYGAVLLSLAAFRTGAFLSFRPGRTVSGHLFLSGTLLVLVVAGLVATTSAWQTRLSQARQRISLLEQQSLQRSLAREPSRMFSGTILLTPVMAPSAKIPGTSLIRGGQIWTGGTLLVEQWALTNSLLLTTNARHAPWTALPGEIRDILPDIHPTLVSASLDARLATLVRWPVVHPANDDSGPTGRSLFLLGLALFAGGCGLLANRPAISLFQRVTSYLLYAGAVVLPVWLFHLWWFTRPSSGGLTSEADGLLRGFALLVPGMLAFFAGFVRRRRLEARIAR